MTLCDTSTRYAPVFMEAKLLELQDVVHAAVARGRITEGVGRECVAALRATNARTSTE